MIKCVVEDVQKTPFLRTLLSDNMGDLIQISLRNLFSDNIADLIHESLRTPLSNHMADLIYMSQNPVVG